MVNFLEYLPYKIIGRNVKNWYISLSVLVATENLIGDTVSWGTKKVAIVCINVNIVVNSSVLRCASGGIRLNARYYLTVGSVINYSKSLKNFPNTKVCITQQFYQNRITIFLLEKKKKSNIHVQHECFLCNKIFQDINTLTLHMKSHKENLQINKIPSKYSSSCKINVNVCDEEMNVIKWMR